MAGICGDNRFEIIAEVKKRLIEGTNIESHPEELAQVNNILFRLWQLDYFKVQYNDANKVIPLPKKASIYRYSLEVFSDDGELVAYDYKNKEWVKLEINNNEVVYVPTTVKRWVTRPY